MTVRPALAPHLSCKSCVFAVSIFPDSIGLISLSGLIRRPAGALLYLLYLLNLLKRPPGGIAALPPKHGVRSPPCPFRPPGRTCTLRARTARPSVAFLRVLCVLCDLKTNWQSIPVFLCVTLCVPLCSKLRRALCFFVVLCVLRVSRKTLHLCPAAPSVARLPRAPFSVLCSPFSGRQSRPFDVAV